MTGNPSPDEQLQKIMNQNWDIDFITRDTRNKIYRQEDIKTTLIQGIVICFLKNVSA
jgi:hypothetical protein